MTSHLTRPPRAADAARRLSARRDALTGAALPRVDGPRPPASGVPRGAAPTDQGRPV